MFVVENKKASRSQIASNPPEICRMRTPSPFLRHTKFNLCSNETEPTRLWEMSHWARWDLSQVVEYNFPYECFVPPDQDGFFADCDQNQSIERMIGKYK
jgi:hypothetical protein